MSSLIIDNSSISYFADESMDCHAIRIILYEKDVSLKMHQNVNKEQLPKEIIDNNPFLQLPTLVDRDLVLYFPRVIIDYLDERFPHPPVLPVTPNKRAQVRLALERIRTDWIAPAEELITLNKRSEKQRKELIKIIRDNLLASMYLFDQNEYLLNDEFSILDCCVLPFLWRLHWMGVNIPAAKSKPLAAYMRTMFKRPSFLRSCTMHERTMIV